MSDAALHDADALSCLQEAIRAAASSRTPLCIRAGGTKDFYGNAGTGVALDPSIYEGILDYEPSELVISARAGTTLAQLEETLSAQGQMLAFEPPRFGAAATVGGCIATGLAGPRRTASGPAHGGVRDFVLGARMIDGRGTLLKFGGTVMKNVAGYDIARLLAGSLGILGVIVEVSLKVLPLPAAQCTLRFDLDEASALMQLQRWSARPWPVSASVWHAGALSVRLSGNGAAVDQARAHLGGEPLPRAEGDALWSSIREQTHEFFASDLPLWRVCVPPTASRLALHGSQLIQWEGGLRWWLTTAPADEIRSLAQAAGGHATLFRGERNGEVFAPLSAESMAIHRRLKAHFDPAGIFNRGRMYLEL